MSLRRLLRPRLALPVMLAVLALGGWLRLAGIQWGLPYLYDVDEPVFVTKAFKVLASRDLNPHWFGHPGTLTIYTNAAAFALDGMRAVVVGEVLQLSELGKAFWSEPSRFYLVARWVAAAFGIATLAVTALLARQFLGVVPALGASLLLAVAPLHVEFSQIARTDAQHTFLLTLFALLCCRTAAIGRLAHYAAAGAVLGLAVSCKYPSVVAALGLITAFVLDQRRARPDKPAAWQPIAVATAACIAAAFVGSPYMFLDFAQVLKDVAGEARTTHLGATSPGFAPSLLGYLEALTLDSFGAASVIAMVVGAGVLATRTLALPVLALAGGYLLFISSLNLHWTRWVIPVLPLFCILLAASLELPARLFAARRLLQRASQVMAALLLCLSVGQGYLASHASVRERQADDNRTLASRWVAQHIPQGTRIAVESGAPQPDNRHYQVYAADERGLLVRDTSPYVYAWTSGNLGKLNQPRDVRAAGIQYVMLGDTLGLMEREPATYAEGIAKYRETLGPAELVYESRPTPGVNRGSHVRIYRLL